MASLSRRHPGSRSSCRDVFGISEQLVIEEITVMITSRKAAKMTAADVNKHTMNHWESRTRAATSVTPSTGRITTRHGAGTGHHARASRITSPSARNHGMDHRRTNQSPLAHGYVERHPSPRMSPWIRGLTDSLATL
jgi:hypothetical protein